MSTIISLSCSDGFVVSSDTQSIYQDDYGLCKELFAKKIIKLPESNLAIVHSGSRKFRQKLIAEIKHNWEPLSGLDSLRQILTTQIKLYNTGIIPNNDNFSQETGLMVIGFFENQKVFWLLTPNGEILENSSYMIMGAGSNYAIDSIRKFSIDSITVEEAIPIALLAIKHASISVFCNEIPSLVIIKEGTYKDLSKEIMRLWVATTVNFHSQVIRYALNYKGELKC